MAASPCPDRTELVDYLLGNISSERHELLTDHIDGCTACQEKIPDLSEEPEAQASVVRGVAAEDPFENELECRQLVAKVAANLTANRPAPPASPAAPPEIPGYDIVRELGRGGMGVVYLAQQVKLKRRVALKMVLAGDHASGEQLARFRAEAEAIAALQHPHIVQIYDIGETAGRPYFVLEYVDGGSLAQRLQGEPHPPRCAARLLQTLALAVQVAHEKGIVHRDLKPANILLQSAGPDIEGSATWPDPDGWSGSTLQGLVKISDFGLAKRLDGSSAQTQSGVLMGTPAYMAPEQAAGKTQEMGPAADLYALGSILYELLTGRPPFRGLTPMDTLWQVIHEEPVPPSRLVAQLPRALEKICLQCLHKLPQKRYASAAALAEDLRRFLADKTIDARPNSPWDRDVSWWRRRPAVAGLTVGLIVVMLGFAGVAWTWRPAVDARRAEVVRTDPPQQAAASVPPKPPPQAEGARGDPPQVVPRVVVPFAGKAYRNSVGMDLIPIAAGEFQMGEEDSGYRVELGRGFFMAAHKTTQGQFQQVMGRNPSYFSASGRGKDKVAGEKTEPFPVEMVTWYDAVEFCNKLSVQENLQPCYRLTEIQRGDGVWLKSAMVEFLSAGNGYRLPTEAEWEYCARAGTTTRFWFGDDEGKLGEHAWFAGNSGDRTHPVGQKGANPWRLYDMGGLVFEWCEDVWHDEDEGAPRDGSAWLSGGNPNQRVVRSGSWHHDEGYCRCAYRNRLGTADNRYYLVGFRVVRVAP